tara:strand:+ start:989 stop:1918 length:930 start_codon:yes stop_codon:yes gene_type:complete
MAKDFDIYQLGGNEGKGSIRAIKNKELKEDLDKCLKKLKKYGFMKEFCEKNNINYSTFQNYISRTDHIPLYVLKELGEISNINFKRNISYLEYGSGATKRNSKVASLSKELASIVGAFIADGHLKQRNLIRNSRPNSHYELIFREGYKSTMDALVAWINKEFDINVKSNKLDNHYYIYISNKIVFRYFTEILNFKPGKKTETVRIPKILKKSSDEIKKSVLKGVLMFDGSVSRKTGYIELYSKSRNLIIDVSELLKDICVGVGYIKLDPDKYGRYRLIIRKKAELEKCLELFESGTEKHERLLKVLRKV